MSASPSTPLIPDTGGQGYTRKRRPLAGSVDRLGGDAILALLTRVAALAVIGMLAALILVLAWAAIPSIQTFGARFLIASDWRPNELEQPKLDATGHVVMVDGEIVTETIAPSFGALPVIYGTVVSSVIALVFAVPLSFGAALFLVRIAHRRLAGPTSFLIEFLAAIPSIAYGIWGLFVLAPLLQGGVQLWGWLQWLVVKTPGILWVTEHPLGWMFKVEPTAGGAAVFFRGVEPILAMILGHVPGLGWLFTETIRHGDQTITRELPLTGRDMFCGGLVLGIMILPIIAAISRDVLRQVPRAQIEGSLALGATWWQSSWEMLRYSRSALFGAVMLGLARAAGETMAITMVIGNNSQIRASIFAPAQTMSSLLANEFSEASTTLHRSALTEVALILLLMSLVFNVVARYLVVGKSARTSAAH